MVIEYRQIRDTHPRRTPADVALASIKVSFLSYLARHSSGLRHPAHLQVGQFVLCIVSVEVIDLGSTEFLFDYHLET